MMAASGPATGDFRRRAGFIAVTTAMLGLSIGVASLSWWPSYATASLPILVAVTFAAAAAIAILGTIFRASSLTVLLATMASYLVLGVPLAVPQLALWRVLPTLDGLRELVFGTATSWKQLLTISLPVGSYQALLVPVFLLTLVTVVISLTVALRSTFPDLAVLGPIAVFIVGILFGPDSAL